MRIVSIIASILIIFIGVVFALKNSANVTIDFGAYQGSAPLSLALVLAFALGAIFGAIGSLLVIVKLKRSLSKLERLASTERKDHDRNY